MARSPQARSRKVDKGEQVCAAIWARLGPDVGPMVIKETSAMQEFHAGTQCFTDEGGIARLYGTSWTGICG